jgi:hypothetical protein
MKKNITLILGIFLALNGLLFAQENNMDSPKAKYRIWVITSNGNMLKGVLMHATDSTLDIFPGSFSDLKKKKNFKIVNESYSNISDIYIKKRAGWLKGMLIGGAIGISPVVFGQAGGFVSIVSLPVGLIAGTIIGSTSRKKFHIGEDPSNFKKFHQKVSKK